MPTPGIEPRDSAHLRIPEFSLALFTPYSTQELEEFLENYQEELERPIDITLRGLVLQGRKRYEAARYEAHRQHKRVSIACIVHKLTEPADVYHKICELMAEDTDHGRAEDRQLAQLVLAHGTTVPRLQDLIPLATGGRVSSWITRARTKVYGTNILSWEARRRVDAEDVTLAQMVTLVLTAEKAFNSKRGVPVLPDKIPSARRYLDSLVEATIRGEPLPKTTSTKKVARSVKHTPAAAAEVLSTPPVGEAPQPTTVNLWRDLSRSLKAQYLADLLEDIDPVVRVVQERRLEEIVDRFHSETDRVLRPMLHSFRSQVMRLRGQTDAQRSITLRPQLYDLTECYTVLNIEELDAATPREEALKRVRSAYVTAMLAAHPDKGGEHNDAAALNAAYAKLAEYWRGKEE